MWGAFAIVGLFLLFPKGFKFLVGSWLGFCIGGLAWSIMALSFTVLMCPLAFLSFSAGGIVAGCVFAAKG